MNYSFLKFVILKIKYFLIKGNRIADFNCQGLSRTIRSVATGTQWSGPMKSRIVN